MSLQSTDPIADLLTRIRNAVAVGKNEITVPSSKMKLSVLEELKKSKYIKSYKVESAKPGISPLEALSRKLIRLKPKRRM